MTYSQKVKSTLDDIIQKMALTPERFCLRPDQDFSRSRKLDFKKTISFSISMQSGCMNHELLKFFQHSPDTPSASAFFQQRSKLKADAFRYLLKEFNSSFPLEKYKGKYFLVACDGSEFNIARNPADAPSFNPPNKTAKKGFNMIHTVSLYDLLNKRYLDMEVQPAKEKNEFLALCHLLDKYSYGGFPIIVADRGACQLPCFCPCPGKQH